MFQFKNEKSWLNLLYLILLTNYFFAAKAQAGLLDDYEISSEAVVVEQSRSVGSGSRSVSGCSSQLPENSVVLLVPEQKVVHRTISSSPSFHVYSQITTSLPFEFTLIDPQTAETVFRKTFAISEPGIKQIKLSESVKLEEGKIYLWYVAIPCEGNPEKDLEVLGAAIERVPLSSEIEKKLNLVHTNHEIAKIYANHGIWYEALKYSLMNSVGDSKQLVAELIK